MASRDESGSEAGVNRTEHKGRGRGGPRHVQIRDHAQGHPAGGDAPPVERRYVDLGQYLVPTMGDRTERKAGLRFGDLVVHEVTHFPNRKLRYAFPLGKSRELALVSAN